ncbi:MAG: fadB2 1 [Ilumatobacteraceae bacterium]|nr:fadB2 1 [Ilumatobacteraceae bacterium]
MKTIERVGVVGCGLMGSGIAEVSARAGLEVTVVESSQAAADAGMMRITKSLDRAVRSGKLQAPDKERFLDGIRISTDLERLSSCDLVVEAIAEDQALKVALFQRLDEIMRGSEAILASNTSSIPIMKLGIATRRPDLVVGVHFFNPVPVLNLVEIVPSLLTSAETVDDVANFAEVTLHKRTIRCQDRAGFVVNALLIPYILSAIRMFESGFASAEDIDTGMIEGCNHPMGPLHLADLIGLDTTLAVAESLYAEFKEPLYAPPPLLSRMVEANLLGRKTERGFFAY